MMPVDLAVAMPQRCVCGHNKGRHEVAGFDGECIGDECRCVEFRPVERTAVVAAVSAAAPPALAHVPPSTVQLLKVAKATGDRRIGLVAQRLEQLFTELLELLAAERAHAVAQQHRRTADAAKVESDRLKTEIAAAPRTVRRQAPATGVCPDCGADKLRNVGAHRARAHGFRAHATTT